VLLPTFPCHIHKYAKFLNEFTQQKQQEENGYAMKHVQGTYHFCSGNFTVVTWVMLMLCLHSVISEVILIEINRIKLTISINQTYFPVIQNISSTH